MIIDSHCHLDFLKLYNQLDKVLERAKANNIEYMLSICTTLESFKKINMITEKYKNVYGTFGIHPHETKDHLDIDSNFIIDIKKKHKKIIGVGETGLDFFYNHSDNNIQKKSFLQHIQAASHLNIPLIVHTRNAETETFEILKNEMKNLNLKVVIHCFTGSNEFAKKLIDLNCYISISGIITFKNSTDLAKTVSNIPIENLLVETDAPYLAPMPHRGRDNEPSYIINTVKKLSEIKNVSEAIIAAATTKNFMKIFNLN